MKILIGADTYYPQVNGASYFTQRLAYYLQRHGNEVLVIAPSESSSYTDTVVNTVRLFGVKSYPVFFYPGFRFCLLPFKSKQIEKIIEDFKPDVIHFQAHFVVNRTVLYYAKKKNIPLAATNHFMPENLVHYLPFPQAVRNSISRFAWRDFAKVYKNMDEITTPTETAANLIRPYFKKEITAISCGIDMSIFKPENANSSALQKKYNIPDLPVLLSVNRLDKEKNIDLVIKAFAEARKQVPFQLVIAGSGAEKNNLMQLAENLGVRNNVIFTGFVPDADLPALYSLADCFVNAGTAELQSIVTMEAMASGLPVLAANAVALPELVKDSQNGFLFAPGNVADLTDKMLKIFLNKNMREEMGKKSLELISKHSIEKSIASFENIYKKAISEHPAHK